MSKSKNTPNQTQSISNKRLKEFEKARLWASETPCMLEFIDCGNLADLDGCDMSLSKEQMNGVFLLLDGVLANLEGISLIASEFGTEELAIRTINQAADDASNIISLAVKLAKVRLAEEENDEESASDDVCMVSVWVGGFLASLRLVNEVHLSNIHQGLHELIKAIPAPSEGGGNAHDSLY